MDQEIVEVPESPPAKRGRPKGSKGKRAILAQALHDGLESVVLEEMPRVINTLFTQAKNGDTQAAALLVKTFMITADQSTRVGPTSGEGGDPSQLGFNLTINVVNSRQEAVDAVLVDGEVLDGE